MIIRCKGLAFVFVLLCVGACGSEDDGTQAVVDAVYITHGIYGEAIYGVIPPPIVQTESALASGPFDTDELGITFENQDTWTPITGTPGTADINFETCSSTHLVLTLVGKVVGKNLDATRLVLTEGTSNVRTDFYPFVQENSPSGGAYGQFINTEGEYIFYVNLDEHATIIGQNGFDILIYANDIQDSDDPYDFGTLLNSSSARTNHQAFCK